MVKNERRRAGKHKGKQQGINTKILSSLVSVWLELRLVMQQLMIVVFWNKELFFKIFINFHKN
jgi:hypothetical protein